MIGFDSLTIRFKPTMSTPIQGFFGDYRFLSNFWICPIEFRGDKFWSTEHAFQCQKTLNPEERLLFKNCKDAAMAKRMGKVIDLRDDWEDIRLQVMEDVNIAKYQQNMDLCMQLYNTGDRELIEANAHKDEFWGVYLGNGHNHLGRILMKIRSQIKYKPPGE